jgi:hypothetical protein
VNWSSRNTQAAAKEDQKSMLLLQQLDNNGQTNKQTRPIYTSGVL